MVDRDKYFSKNFIRFYWPHNFIKGHKKRKLEVLFLYCLHVCQIKIKWFLFVLFMNWFWIFIKHFYTWLVHGIVLSTTHQQAEIECWGHSISDFFDSIARDDRLWIGHRPTPKNATRSCIYPRTCRDYHNAIDASALHLLVQSRHF